MDPEDRGRLGPLLALFPGALRDISVDAHGSLKLIFESGAALTVPPDSHYEAWQVAGPGTRVVVCNPSGSGLDVWD